MRLVNTTVSSFTSHEAQETGTPMSAHQIACCKGRTYFPFSSRLASIFFHGYFALSLLMSAWTGADTARRLPGITQQAGNVCSSKTLRGSNGASTPGVTSRASIAFFRSSQLKPLNSKFVTGYSPEDNANVLSTSLIVDSTGWIEGFEEELVRRRAVGRKGGVEKTSR